MHSKNEDVLFFFPVQKTSGNSCLCLKSNKIKLRPICKKWAVMPTKVWMLSIKDIGWVVRVETATYLNCSSYSSNMLLLKQAFNINHALLHQGKLPSEEVNLFIISLHNDISRGFIICNNNLHLNLLFS